VSRTSNRMTNLIHSPSRTGWTVASGLEVGE
jgi:hypothetical protein